MRSGEDEPLRPSTREPASSPESACASDPFPGALGEGSPELKEGWRAGLSLIESGAHEEGLARLEEAYETDALDPECQSAYALGLALACGRLPESVVLAQQAVRTDHHNPRLYLNLSRIHLACGSRADALQTLARGLRVAPEHPGLQQARAELGLRNRIWFSFLPRAHWLNRGLGILRACVRRQFSRAT